MDVEDSISEDEDHHENRIINEEYKRWKKNTPFLYDLVVAKALDWPSLTVEWFPHVHRTEGAYSVQGLLMGTHTSNDDDDEQNYLLVAECHLPIEDTALTGNGGPPAKVEIKQKINHPGEVNRARLVPQMPWVIATKSTSADVLIFNTKNHPATPQDNSVKNELFLKGHTSRLGNSYGMSWNLIKEGYLLSAAEDQTICLWDIEGGTPLGQNLKAMTTFRAHTHVVEDVAWHPMHETFFASVGDDKLAIIWDSRDLPNKPVVQIQAHNDAVNCISFNPFDEVYCLTGSSDKTVALWDLRNLKTKLHSFEGHSADINQVQWSPHYSTVFASSSADRRVNIWDLKRIGATQTDEEKEDGCPELLFVHGGHTARVSDVCWSPNDPYVLASVAEDNILHVWKMAQPIYEPETTTTTTDATEAP